MFFWFIILNSVARDHMLRRPHFSAGASQGLLRNTPTSGNDPSHTVSRKHGEPCGDGCVL